MEEGGIIRARVRESEEMQRDRAGDEISQEAIYTTMFQVRFSVWISLRKINGC